MVKACGSIDTFEVEAAATNLDWAKQTFSICLCRVYNYCMDCRFLQNGIAIDYSHTVKPCCIWQPTDQWREQNQFKNVNFVDWHQSNLVQNAIQQLAVGQWPNACGECQRIESNGRFDSMRGNGNHAYKNFEAGDITMEIRPGNTCNFACQTCWPEASSRVTQYQLRAGIIDSDTVVSERITDFDRLLPIVHRIKTVVLLGGEPFYDKNCLAFLAWANQNLTAELTIFTNGSSVDFDFVKNYKGKINLVFSLDAIGRAAEYIRFGTEWRTVASNYRKALKINTASVRVNVTCSIYNYSEIEDLFNFLLEESPAMVTFGEPMQSWMREGAVPDIFRKGIVDQLRRAQTTVAKMNLAQDQLDNGLNALESIINNFNTTAWSESDHSTWCTFTNKLDQAKQVFARDTVPILGQILDYKSG